MRRLLHITCSKWRILYCILQATLLKANRKYRPPLAAYFFAFFAHGNKRQQRNVRGLRNLPYRRLIADDLDVHGVAVHHGVQDVLGGVLQAVEGDAVLCPFVLASIVFSISVSIRLKRRSI